MFEGDNGLFSIGAGGCGGAVAGLKRVERATHVGRASQNVEWYVGRAYSLLQEVGYLVGWAFWMRLCLSIFLGAARNDETTRRECVNLSSQELLCMRL